MPPEDVGYPVPSVSSNQFSKQWFSTFMHTMPQDWTRVEVDGVMRRLPLPGFSRLLDVCCGTGRHAALLAERGYEVTGIDRDEDALSRARSLAPRCTFHRLDQRELRDLDGPFDAAMILWQSFGYFDARANDRVLADLAALIRPGGRLLLDLFHPGYFVGDQNAARPPRAEGVVITNEVREGRLASTIEYADGSTETMNFELFAPEQIIERAARTGFTLVEQCCWWDEQHPPDPSVQRYQSVFER